VLHLAFDRGKNLRLWKFALQEFGSVENVVGHAGLRFILPGATAIHKYLAAIHESTPGRAKAPHQQDIDIERAIRLSKSFQTPLQVIRSVSFRPGAEVWVDEGER
jgi:hypothetical protein